jgi:HTH-type transcriptional regulator/antitoxin HigA
MTKSQPAYQFEPDYAVPPGETLAELLDERNMSQADLARRTDLSTKHINQIVAGEAAISPETALRLERVTHVPARFWTQLEAHYQQQRSREAEVEALLGDVSWLEQLPVEALIDRQWIERRRAPVEQLLEVLSFFGVASRSAWETLWDVPTAYRRSRAFDSDLNALAAWLRIGELRAEDLQCEPFDRGRLRAAVSELRALTLIQDPATWLPLLREKCAEVGIAVVLEPEIPGARINGAVRWLASDRVLLELSLRHRWSDIFWFSFFHEIGHVLLHERKRLTFVDGTGIDGDELERDADSFASRVLIPKDFESELAALKPSTAIRAFAERLGVGPGIVVGRLQHDHLLGYHQLNSLRSRLKFTSPPQ